MARVLVTGGAGFIGSALCRHLVGDLGWSVLNVDKLTYAGNLESVRTIAEHPRYRFAKADICDRSRIEELLATFRPTHIAHLAAESHVDRSINSAEPFLATNVTGTFVMLEAARRYWEALPAAEQDAFRFLHISTDEVYGSLGSQGLFREDTPYDPSSPYSASKAAADHLVLAWHRTYGLPTLVSNCSNNYGPYHFPEKLIPLIILNGMHGNPLPVYGDGGHIRDWLYVEDHVRALASILQNGTPGARYNVGGRSERQNIEVVRQICRILDATFPDRQPHDRLVAFVPDRPGHDRRYAVDATKLERELNWHPHESFETGIEKTVRWYCENEWWWRPLRDRVYGGERLGLVGSAARS